ncbi:MAG: NERD domain-containing protein [Spirochaetes bacterium]|jgi:hypothetical protein|nr:NERD domain-containing protein [Spirochaetota bacterium]
MAKFHPDIPPRNIGEKTVLHCLRRYLDDSFSVVQNYTYEFKKPGEPWKKYGEVDFIIINETIGIVFLEVKGGTVCIDDRGFYREGENGKKDREEFGRENPFEEAERHMFDVMDLLAIASGRKSRDYLRFPYCSLAVFPHCEFNGDMRFRNKYMNAGHMDGSLESRLMEAVDALAPGNKLANIDREDLELAKKYLAGEVHSNPNLRPMLNAVESEMVELTEKQVFILNDKLDRAIVYGGPGTGKSILAAAKADQLADAGHRVLLLCYNRALAKQLGKCARHENIIVGAWCEYMDEFVRRIDPRLPVPGTGIDEITQYYHHDLPDLFRKNINAEQGDPWRPDAVIMDEGQDFNIDMLNALVDYFPGIETKPFIVLLDPVQNIFFKGEKTEGLYKKYIEREHHIDGSYRVSREINEYTGTVLPDDYILHRSYIEGGEVREFFHSGRDEHNRLVSEAMRDLHSKKINKKEIMVISFRHLEDSFLENKIGDDLLVDGRIDCTMLDELKENQVLYYTVRTSKGLEAPAVLLVDVPKKSLVKKDGELARLFYIGATRAKYFLYCFYEKE